MGSIPAGLVSLQEWKIWIQTPTEALSVKTLGEDHHVQTEEGLEQILPSWPLKETNPADTWISDCQPPELRKTAVAA